MRSRRGLGAALASNSNVIPSAVFRAGYGLLPATFPREFKKFCKGVFLFLLFEVFRFVYKILKYLLDLPGEYSEHEAISHAVEI